MFHPDQLLTEDDVGHLLGVSRTTLWRLRTRKGLPFLRIGSKIRYEPAALREWVTQQSQPRRQRDILLDAARSASEREWKRTIEETDWSFKDERTDEVTHHLHPYPAKFPPPLPRRLIEILTRPGSTVLDPFCGSGTTLVEAKALGRGSIGVDTNPVAVLASSAKTLVLDENSFAALAGLDDAIEADISRATGRPLLAASLVAEVAPVPPPEIPNRDRWFTAQAMHELGIILARVQSIAATPASTVARACFSAIVIHASNQDSETRYTAKLKYREPGEVLQRFRTRVKDAVRMHEEWKAVASPATAVSLVGDARRVDPHEVGLADAVVTSPPYANAFDYHLYHRHRLFWLGFKPQDVRRVEIGSHLNHQNDEDAISAHSRDLQECLRAITACLRPRAPLAFVIGDSLFNGKLINYAAEISDIGRELGLRTLACADRTIHSSKRSMIRPARRARQEHVLLLVKE